MCCPNVLKLYCYSTLAMSTPNTEILWMVQMTDSKDYKSNVFAPIEDIKRVKVRAKSLRIAASQLARLVLVLAIERGDLPESVPDIPQDVDKMNFPFVLDSEIIKILGGRDRARDYVRWAVMEGLDKSLLSTPS